MTHLTMTPQLKARMVPALIAGIVLLTLSIVGVPRMVDASNDARADRSRGIVANVRAGIAGFYANTARRGTARFPTRDELTTPGVVLPARIAPNPYNDDARVVDCPGAWLESPRPAHPDAGWCYDPLHGQFWNAVHPGSDPPGGSEPD